MWGLVFLEVIIEAVGVGHSHLVDGLLPAGNLPPSTSRLADAAARFLSWRVDQRVCLSIVQIINHSVFSADSSLVNYTRLRVALRSSLLNDSIEFVV